MATAFCHVPYTSKLPLLIRKNIQPRLSTHKPWVTAMHEKRAYCVTMDAEISTHLMKFLPTSPPPYVTEPMRHLLSAAPPTIAPTLCITACELVGGERERALDAGCALHLMHAAAHAHGRLPAVLGSRPGERSGIYPAGVELLTGDGMLPLGYELVARSGSDPKQTLRVIMEIVHATGPQGMVEGQWMEAKGGAPLRAVVEKKEGKLGGCGAACGAILGGGGEEAVEKLRRFGMYAGMMHGLLICAQESSGDEREVVEAAEEFRAMARMELEGFKEGKKEVAYELVDLWYEKGRKGVLEVSRNCKRFPFRSDL